MFVSEKHLIGVLNCSNISHLSVLWLLNYLYCHLGISVFNNSNTSLCKCSWHFFHLFQHILCVLNVLGLYIWSSLGFSFGKLFELVIDCFAILSFLILLLLLKFISFFNLFILKQFGLHFKVFSSIFSSLLFFIKPLIFGISFIFDILQLLINHIRCTVEKTSDVFKTFISNFSVFKGFMLFLIIEVWKHIFISVFTNWSMSLTLLLSSILFIIHILLMQFLQQSLLLCFF